MDTNLKRDFVGGTFESPRAAARALEKLSAAHFDIQAEASVVVEHDGDQKTVPILSDVPCGRGALIGASIGVLLAAIVVVVGGLDFGPFSLEPWGPVWAWFETAYAGAGIGVATGVMVSFEFAKPQAAFHLTGIERGLVRVGVRARGARAELARKIFVESGAMSSTDHGPELIAA